MKKIDTKDVKVGIVILLTFAVLTVAAWISLRQPSSITIGVGSKGKFSCPEGKFKFYNKGRAADADVLVVLVLRLRNFDTNMLFLPIPPSGEKQTAKNFSFAECQLIVQDESLSISKAVQEYWRTR